MEINFILPTDIDPKDVVRGLGVAGAYNLDDQKSIEVAIQEHLKRQCLIAAELTKNIRLKIV